MDLSNELKKLCPEELDIIKDILDKLIVEVKNDKNTNIKYQDKNKLLNCPKCKDVNAVKNGKKNNKQYYKCNV